MDNNELIAKAMEILGKAMLIYVIIAFIIFVLKVIARWKLFSKMGESGWKSIIPIYNTIVLYDCIWTTAAFWFSIFLSFLGGLASAILKLFENGTLDRASKIMGYVFMGCQYYLIGAGVIILILGIIFNYKFSKAFGHGIFFALGLMFLPRIFEMILAFGKSEYQY